MLKRLAILAVLAAAAGVLLGLASSDWALAHQCSSKGAGHPGHKAATTRAPAKKAKKPKCKETPVVPNWRDNYIPLFDLEDRDDPNQRYEAQRWRDECEHHDQEFAQQCAWYYGGTSLFPNEDGSGNAPNELHAGVAATHCFLFEFAHQCEGHDEGLGESVHDAHGGAIYVDVCLEKNAESKYCREGLADTQVGVTILDHFPCGAPIPIAYCIDEYHVVRPFDSAYTQSQMENSGTATQAIVDDPHTYLCGFGPGAEDCIAPALPAQHSATASTEEAAVEDLTL
jgi:hypothetical protein